MQMTTKSYEISEADVLNKSKTPFPPSPSMSREASCLQKHSCGILHGEGGKGSRGEKLFLNSSQKCTLKRSDERTLCSEDVSSYCIECSFQQQEITL